MTACPSETPRIPASAKSDLAPFHYCKCRRCGYVRLTQPESRIVSALPGASRMVPVAAQRGWESFGESGLLTWSAPSSLIHCSGRYVDLGCSGARLTVFKLRKVNRRRVPAAPAPRQNRGPTPTAKASPPVRFQLHSHRPALGGGDPGNRRHFDDFRGGSSSITSKAFPYS